MINANHFWSKVMIGATDECWPWTGECNKRRGGYGYYRVKRQRFYAHRVAHELATGKPPGKLHVLHSCDNPPCCNPQHLRAGTPADNTQDRISRGRTRSKTKVPPEAVEQIRKLYTAGMSSAAIGRQFRISQQQAHRLATGQSQRHASGEVLPPPWKAAGRSQPGMKLTAAQVDEIRSLWATGEHTQAALAEQFEVTQPHVSKIVNNLDRTV